MLYNSLNYLELQNHFKDHSSFSRRDILQFYKLLQPKVKDTTINWRIHTLIEAGILTRIGRGRYKFGEGRRYVPFISSTLKSLYRKIHTRFPYIEMCLWNTSILNELMTHQSGRYYTLVEAEKDTMESIFYFLKDSNKNVFLDPSEDIINLYAYSEKEAVIIKPLVSEAPTQKVQGVPTVTMEKMLVDIFCDTIIFQGQQGNEMHTIFLNSFDKYSVNENKMLRYANRRRKKEAFKTYLNKLSKYR